MSDVLQKIIAHKQLEIAAAREARPIEAVQEAARTASPPRDFYKALTAAYPTGLIAEVKKASPSAGLIREDFDPVAIGQAYERAGAACISVLTDEKFFQGHLDFLTAVRSAVRIPVLRKDFIIDPYQVWEARAAGADCILLIAECLDDQALQELHQLACDLGMPPLIEIYEPDNIDRVLSLSPPMIGINNRNLRTFVTDLNHTASLRKRIPEDVLVIGESGIHTRADVEFLVAADVHGILVGESLMRKPDIEAAARALLHP